MRTKKKLRRRREQQQPPPRQLKKHQELLQLVPLALGPQQEEKEREREERRWKKIQSQPQTSRESKAPVAKMRTWIWIE